jgi:hypothetical protein
VLSSVILHGNIGNANGIKESRIAVGVGKLITSHATERSLTVIVLNLVRWSERKWQE